MYFIIFFIVIPIILIFTFLLTILYPNVTIKFGGTTNIVNFTISLLTYLYVVLTGTMVRQMKENSEEESRPYIVVDIESNKQMIYFVVKNIGKLPAKDLAVHITPNLETIINKSLNDTIFSKPISLVPPGKEIKTIIGVSHEVLAEGKNMVFDVKFHYNWGKSKRAEELYTIDISFYKTIAYVTENGTHEIAKTLDKIERSLSKVVKWDGIYIKTHEDVLREAEEFKKNDKDLNRSYEEAYQQIELQEEISIKPSSNTPF